MTKEEAIKILKEERWYMSRYSEEYKEAYDMAIEALQDRPKGDWIPCSERLPSEEGRYMVTHKAFTDMTFIDLFYYGKPSMPNCKVKGWCWYRSDDEYGDVVYEDPEILAWIPLPKPYKGGDTE